MAVTELIILVLVLMLAPVSTGKDAKCPVAFPVCLPFPAFLSRLQLSYDLILLVCSLIAQNRHFEALFVCFFDQPVMCKLIIIAVL